MNTLLNILHDMLMYLTENCVNDVPPQFLPIMNELQTKLAEYLD